MWINALTKSHMADQRSNDKTDTMNALEINIKCVYEVNFGILDYRTGRWIWHDSISFHNRAEAVDFKDQRFKYPIPGQNAVNMIRRYKIENETSSKAMENIR